MKRVSLAVLVLMLVLVQIGCSASAPNLSTQDDAAKTFVQAMIDGDYNLMDEVNRSDSWDAPTNFVMTEFAPQYAEYKLSDFDFYTIGPEETELITVRSRDDKIKQTLRIRQIGNNYYFVSFR